MANCGLHPELQISLWQTHWLMRDLFQELSFEYFQESAIRMAGRLALHARRPQRRNGFISFISRVSMLGIALGVAALIIVLSVMNGFQKEVRDRMLVGARRTSRCSAPAAAMPDWQPIAPRRAQQPGGDRRRALRRGAGAAGARRRHARRRRARHRSGSSSRRCPTSAKQMRAGTLRRAACRANSASCSASSWRARWASRRRQGDADLAAGAGHAGRRHAAPEAVHRGRHLRVGPQRVRLGAGARSTSRTRRSCSACDAPTGVRLQA